MRAVQRLFPAIGEDEPTAPSDSMEHAIGQRPNDLEAFGIGIQEDELVHGQPIGTSHQSLDELGRVRASPTGDGHLHTHGTASYTAAVKSLGNFPDPFYTEIAGQPEALRRAAAGLREQRETLRSVSRLVMNDTVILTGMGGSYAACYPLAADLAEAGLTAVMLGSAELLHFRAGILGPSTPVIAVSQSGESAEIVHLAETLRGCDGAASMVAVTNGTDNTLARTATLVLDTRAGDETGPSTRTFAAGLVTLAAIGRVLKGATPDAACEALTREAERAAISIERLLANGTLGDELLAWLGPREDVVVLGRGPARAAAEMAALTLKEAAGLAAEALESAQFRHGPLEIAGPDLAVIVVATEPETEALDRALARELSDVGAAVLEITRSDRPSDASGSSSGPGSPAPWTIGIGAIDRSIAPAVSIVPLQSLAHRLAIARGREPGTYLRAAKVTTRE
jgi:glutamine---fructose-6-phosphate transaminase (isomerizing)